MRAIGGLLVAATLAIGSGCAARPDWIERTLVTVDVTGNWHGTASAGALRITGPDELWLDLQQEGRRVKGSFSRLPEKFSGGAYLFGPIEGAIAGDIFSFTMTSGGATGELTGSGDQMTGTVNGRAFILRRVGSSSRPGA